MTFVRQLPTKPLLPGTWIYYGKSPSQLGKSTINVPCSIARLNYQRVYRYLKHPLILDYFLGEPLVLHIYAGLLVCVFLVFRVSLSIRGYLVAWGSVVWKPSNPA